MAPSTIHYVCLDIEGAEPTVLGAFDLRGGPYTVLAMSVEGHRCDELMRGAGYLKTNNPFTNELYERYYLHPQLVQTRPELLSR